MEKIIIRELTNDEKLSLNHEFIDFISNNENSTIREIEVFKTGYKLGIFSKDFKPIDKLIPKLIEKYAKSKTQLLIQVEETEIYHKDFYTARISFVNNTPFFLIDNINKTDVSNFVVSLKNVINWKEI